MQPFVRQWVATPPHPADFGASYPFAGTESRIPGRFRGSPAGQGKRPHGKTAGASEDLHPLHPTLGGRQSSDRNRPCLPWGVARPFERTASPVPIEGKEHLDAIRQNVTATKTEIAKLGPEAAKEADVKQHVDALEKHLAECEKLCGMWVAPDTASARRMRDGQRLVICSLQCPERFDAEPSAYLTASNANVHLTTIYPRLSHGRPQV